MVWLDLMETFQGLGAVLAIAATATGYWLVRWQLQSATQAALCQQSVEILTFIGEHEETYEYLYHKRQLGPQDAHRVRVLVACEMVANFLENVLLQSKSIPAGARVSWSRFVGQSLASSPELCAFIQDRPDWYCAALVKRAMSAAAVEEHA